MFKRRSKRSPMAEMNVVPYVDVMLVLLVIFMVTAPLLSQGVEVTLPQANAEVLPEQDQPPLVLTVDAIGQYFLNEEGSSRQSLDAAALQLQVAAQLQLDPLRDVLVRGDQGASYGDVVGAMVLLQQAGVETVGLVTQTPQE